MNVPLPLLVAVSAYSLLITILLVRTILSSLCSLASFLSSLTLLPVSLTRRATCSFHFCLGFVHTLFHKTEGERRTGTEDAMRRQLLDGLDGGTRRGDEVAS